MLGARDEKLKIVIIVFREREVRFICVSYSIYRKSSRF